MHSSIIEPKRDFCPWISFGNTCNHFLLLLWQITFSSETPHFVSHSTGDQNLKAGCQQDCESSGSFRRHVSFPSQLLEAVYIWWLSHFLTRLQPTSCVVSSLLIDTSVSFSPLWLHWVHLDNLPISTSLI